MEWTPANIRGAQVRDPQTGLLSAEGIINRWVVYEDMNTLDTTGFNQATIEAYDSYRQYDATKNIVLERDNKLLAKQMNAPWAMSDASLQSNGLPKASVGVAIGYTGIEPGTTLGHIRLTYFVTFRG